LVKGECALPFLTVPDQPGREGLTDFLRRGGYRGLQGLTGPAVIGAAEAARLRGRGGSGRGEPLVAKLRAVGAGAAAGPHYVVANGAETSPGSRKDQLLMERYPHRILAGAIAAARAVGSTVVYLYIKASAVQARTSMQAALTELAGAGLPDLPAFDVFRAPDSTVAGEETAVCDAIEGFEGRPQVKPPTPDTAGILGRPTLIVNVETLAALDAVLRVGPAGAATALFTLSGDVARPGVYELPLGTPLRTLITDYGGGATGEIVAVLPGGFRSGPLTPRELDLPLDYDALLEAGTTLGSAHVIVLAHPNRFLDLMTGALDLAAIGSCRQCEICAEGTLTLRNLAHRMAEADGEPEAPLREALAAWSTILHGKGNCKYLTGVASLTRRAVQQFPTWREEAIAHVRHR